MYDSVYHVGFEMIVNIVQSQTGYDFMHQKPSITTYVVIGHLFRGKTFF